MDKKILIIKTAALGDVLRTTCILPGLKETYISQIYWVTAEGSKPLLNNNKLIDKVLVFDKNIKKKLKNFSFELVVNLDDDYEACELASFVKSKNIFGGYLDSESKKIKYSLDSSEWFDMGLISRFGKKRADELKIINRRTHPEMICNGLKIKHAPPFLELTPKQLAFAEKFRIKNNIQKDDIIVGINPGASKVWKMKAWNAESVVELMNKLGEEPNVKVILFGGPDEKERNKGIIRKTKNSKKHLIDAGCDNTLEEFISLINLCHTLLTSDSLALHVGISLGKNVNAIFGPTSHHEIYLYGRGNKIVPDLPCITCYKRTCDKEVNCMNSIEVQAVFDKIKKHMPIPDNKSKGG